LPAQVNSHQIITNYTSGNGGRSVVFIPETDLAIVLTKQAGTGTARMTLQKNW